MMSRPVRFDPSHEVRLIRDIKADLHALLQTALFLRERHETRTIDTDFYYRQLRGFYSDIGVIQEELKNHNTGLLACIDRYSTDEALRNVIQEILSIEQSKYAHKSQFQSQDPLRLASIVSDITSSFITLLDYLHLSPEPDPGFILELVNKLRLHLNRDSRFEPFLQQILQLHSLLYEEVNQPDYDYAGTFPSCFHGSLQKMEEYCAQIYQQYSIFVQDASNAK